ncbi:MAG: hypothetical protein JO163_11220 [Methylobacteriaceae bacterium]|nr:hypothetical protein [Methylobacteriaceae bacterium]MBV9703290.1 hypothetical protein [Methylobacteriaceae bacterium]
MDYLRRRLADAESRVANQTLLIADLQRNGDSTEGAEALLRAMIESVRLLRQRLEKVEMEDPEGYLRSA